MMFHRLMWTNFIDYILATRLYLSLYVNVTSHFSNSADLIQLQKQNTRTKYHEILPAHTKTRHCITHKIPDRYFESQYQFSTLQKNSDYFWTRVYDSRVCPRDNTWPVKARITNCVPEVQTPFLRSLLIWGWFVAALKVKCKVLGHSPPIGCVCVCVFTLTFSVFAVWCRILIGAVEWYRCSTSLLLLFGIWNWGKITYCLFATHKHITHMGAYIYISMYTCAWFSKTISHISLNSQTTLECYLFLKLCLILIELISKASKGNTNCHFHRVEPLQPCYRLCNTLSIYW